MTNDIKVLIECIQRGDLQAIRAAALQVLRSDRTQKDANYCKYMIGALERKKKCFELPANLADVLIVEDTNETFIPERYYLTDANKAILDDIVAVNSVAARLSQKRIRYANSTLLYGESGTGKTTFGRCVANQLGLPFLYISFSSLISSLLGETGKRLKKVFDFVCEQRCVFMIDELDAIGTTRGSSQDVTEISRVAIALMQALDTIGNNVILIGATNRIKDIDPAILRRFTRKYEVKKFTAPESCAFVKKYLEDCGFSVTGEMLAAATKSNTPSELERNINELIVNLEIQKGECSI